MATKLRLGTRGSKLAMAQATSLRDRMLAQWPDANVQIVTIRTSGDRGDRDALGAFVKEIQEALLAEEIDLALHCLKDLPTRPVPGLTLAAHLEREDASDTIITPREAVAGGTPWTGLRPGAVVGTGSVRRTSQLLALRPDLQFKPLVGNVDTRLRKLQEGEYDAIVLAIAGLNRLGVMETWATGHYQSLTVTPLPLDVMLPAPGQGVLVIETRSGDAAAREVARHFEHVATRVGAAAERAFLAAFGGGCSVPVAALANCDSGTVSLVGLVASPDGARVLRGTKAGPAKNSVSLGKALAADLLAQGAGELFTPRAPLGSVAPSAQAQNALVSPSGREPSPPGGGQGGGPSDPQKSLKSESELSLKRQSKSGAIR